MLFFASHYQHVVTEMLVKHRRNSFLHAFSRQYILLRISDIYDTLAKINVYTTSFYLQFFAQFY